MPSLDHMDNVTRPGFSDMPVPTALITGCSSGLGRGFVNVLKKKKYRVFASARNLKAIADLTAANIDIVRLDVRDPKSIATAVDVVMGQVGRIGLCVCNAGAL